LKTVYCLDVEGILIPEIWMSVAKKTRIKALNLTTRDIPDYKKLMNYRLKILKDKGIRLRDIQRVIRKMKPLPGAKSFLKKLQAEGRVVLVSGTYYEFAGPLMAQLGNPKLYCNRLRVNRKGMITGYRLRNDEKRGVVRKLKKQFYVKAVGDSFNDLDMLKAADRGILFNPPSAIRKKYRRFPVARNYRKLLQLFIA